ncbi:MAG: archease [Promethearchaeota archaeon]
MSTKKFEFVDLTTSDVAFRAWGQSIEEVFCNAAEAMFSIMFDLEMVPPIEQVNVEVEAQTEESLLYAWLSDLLLEAEVNGYFFSSFHIEKIWNENERFYCVGKGIGSEAKQEYLETLVKGVTYHQFSLKKEQGKFVATVVVDI